MPSASPVAVTAIFSPAPGRSAALRDALVAAIPAVHHEEGCELYAIHDAPDGTIVMIEKWSTRELLEAHSIGEPVAALNTLIEGMLAQPVAITVLEPIAAGEPDKGAL